jgi:hypothetical protein
MKKIFRYIIICSCAGFLSGWTANAQEKRQMALSVEPLYIFNNAMRINLEKKMTAKDWLGLNMTGYYAPYGPDGYGSATSNSDFLRVDKLRGIGIGGTYKRYFARICFINLGADCTFFDVQNNDEYGFRKFREDGLVFYEYGLIDTHSYFKKLTTNVNFGIHSTFHRVFFVEPYIGMGVAYSFYDSSYPEKYNETMFGFGYRGAYLSMGVKLGFNIPPARRK